MPWLWLLASALALPPDGLAALVEIGTGRLEGMTVSWDGDVLIGVDRGTNSAFLVHVEDWSVQTLAPCSVLSVAFIGFEDHYGELYAGCADGTVRVYEWNPDAGTLSDILVDGAVFSIDVGESVDGLWFSSVNGGDGGTLYAAYAPAGGAVTIHGIDPVTGAVDGESGLPLSLQTFAGLEEGVLLDDENTLVLHHGGQNLTTIQLQTGYGAPNQPIGGMSPVDIFPSWAGGVYGVGNPGVMSEFVSSIWTPKISGLDDPKAVIASLDPSDAWVSVTGGNVRVWRLDSTTGDVIGDVDTPWFASDPEPNQQNWIQDGTTSDGYLWGGGTSGFLHVATARPWVEPASVTVSRTAATAGDAILVGATLAEAGDWEVRRGGDRDRTGVLVASGSAGAGPIEAEITVDQAWDEGTNYLYVFLQDIQNQWGHARTSIAIDNPPDAPVLLKPDLAFGDRQLHLSFDGLPDADLARYEVYVTRSPFEPGDFATGGPVYDGTTKLKTPIAVTAEPGARVTVDIQPLTNDVKHYVAVRAVDQGGLVGPMSNVLSQTPRPAYSAAELAGEMGGGVCATTPGAAGWLAIGLTGLLAMRRRSGAALAGAVAVAALSTPAMAQDSGKKGLERDMTKQRGDFELRYGGISLADRNINRVYNETQNNILQLEFGPQITRFAEVDVGMGFFQELSHKIDASGRQSGERTMLTWWPALSLDGSLRLHLLDEQIVVPYARAGFDWIVWSEKSDQGTGKDVIRGDKWGMHYGLGGSLLLDVFDRKRASLLEATTGINDTYLTFEWRKQQVDNRELPWGAARRTGLDFGATMFTVGLKLDY